MCACRGHPRVIQDRAPRSSSRQLGLRVFVCKLGLHACGWHRASFHGGTVDLTPGRAGGVHGARDALRDSPSPASRRVEPAGRSRSRSSRAVTTATSSRGPHRAARRTPPGGHAAAARHSNHATGLLVQDAARHTRTTWRAASHARPFATRSRPLGPGVLPQAVAASERAHGRRHRLCRCCALARMVVQRSGDHTLAEAPPDESATSGAPTSRRRRWRQRCGSSARSGGAAGDGGGARVARPGDGGAAPASRQAPRLTRRGAPTTGGEHAPPARRMSAAAAPRNRRAARRQVGPGFVHHAPKAGAARGAGGGALLFLARLARGSLYRYLTAPPQQRRQRTPRGARWRGTAELAARRRAWAAGGRARRSRRCRAAAAAGGGRGTRGSGGDGPGKLATQPAAAQGPEPMGGGGGVPARPAVPPGGARRPTLALSLYEVISLRMRLHKYDLAARDCAHVLQMTSWCTGRRPGSSHRRRWLQGAWQAGADGSPRAMR